MYRIHRHNQWATSVGPLSIVLQLYGLKLKIKLNLRASGKWNKILKCVIQCNRSIVSFINRHLKYARFIFVEHCRLWRLKFETETEIMY